MQGSKATQKSGLVRLFYFYLCGEVGETENSFCPQPLHTGSPPFSTPAHDLVSKFPFPFPCYNNVLTASWNLVLSCVFCSSAQLVCCLTL